MVDNFNILNIDIMLNLYKTKTIIYLKTFFQELCISSIKIKVFAIQILIHIKCYFKYLKNTLFKMYFKFILNILNNIKIFKYIYSNTKLLFL